MSGDENTAARKTAPRRRLPWGLGAAALAAASLFPWGSAQAAEAPPTELAEETEPATCVSYRTQARFSVGYDHLVYVTNACERPVSCHVRTDVNPSGPQIQVAPGRTETVVTYRGSPASSFTAEVTCAWAAS